jgi:hypothetical protein
MWFPFASCQLGIMLRFSVFVCLLRVQMSFQYIASIPCFCMCFSLNARLLSFQGRLYINPLPSPISFHLSLFSLISLQLSRAFGVPHLRQLLLFSIRFSFNSGNTMAASSSDSKNDNARGPPPVLIPFKARFRVIVTTADEPSRASITS